jgi:peptidoglycan/xylan/chitin deacetylase (PgdA/CDA1 family)
MGAKYVGKRKEILGTFSTLLLSAVIIILGYAEVFRGAEWEPERIVVLTFDDAVKSHRTFVAPLLKKLGFGATFFVTQCWMNDSENFMTWKEIAEIHEMGFEIGNHSWTHADFSQPSNAARLSEELKQVETELERVGVPRPTSFAYCGNGFGPESIDVLKKRSYRLARRGMQPEIPYGQIQVGPTFDPLKHHPLLIPTSGDAYPGWTLDHFRKVVDRAGKGQIVVLQFHGVPDLQHPWVNTSPELFAQLMTYLKEQKFRVVALRGIEPSLPKTTPVDPLLQTRYPPLKERRFYLGFTSWPSGPTPQAVEETYQFISQNADVLTEHIEGVPWTEALEGKPFAEAFQKNIEQRRRHRPQGLKLVLAISPLNMGRNGLASYFGEQENMPLPKVFQGKSFNDPTIKQAYLNYCRRMAEYFDPDYFIIGIETNELLKNTPAEWEPFLELSRYVRTELKKRFPSLPMAHSVTLHVLLDKKIPQLDTYQKKIREFISPYDFNAVSFYPFFLGLHHYDEFITALRAIRQLSDKPIAISESGHPAEAIVTKTWNLNIPSSPKEQNDFVKALLSQAQEDRYLFVTQFASRDFDELWKTFPEEVKDLGRLWRDTGLVDENDTKRPAFHTWADVLAKRRL